MLLLPRVQRYFRRIQTRGSISPSEQRLNFHLPSKLLHSLHLQMFLDIFSVMDGMSFTKCTLVGRVVQKYQQAFFTSRTRPAELRKSVPSIVRFLLPLGE
ncbi:hypothetical protein NPIL_406961 [Nephila pilipes]|uniref:Uncharacterized protein n=1 Tax=Nephila pilipes TaxID=299642 RepID=A0A8X6QRG8_NEPPI|nr:hypothetical protein NPIL_406961 [Nephila pilipes]